MTEPTTNSNTLQCGVLQLQEAIDACMKKHWDDFRKDAQQHFDVFRKDYIEPSIHFIEHEKKEADSKYDLLQQEHNAMRTKCSDLERYNSLLQEKIETIEKEMASFSQVSMIAKWEKRLHVKNQECEKIQDSLDKSKAHVHRLQQENTLLNTRLEKQDLHLAQCTFEGKDGVIGEFTMDTIENVPCSNPSNTVDKEALLSQTETKPSTTEASVLTPVEPMNQSRVIQEQEKHVKDVCNHVEVVTSPTEQENTHQLAETMSMNKSQHADHVEVHDQGNKNIEPGFVDKESEDDDTLHVQKVKTDVMQSDNQKEQEESVSQTDITKTNESATVINQEERVSYTVKMLKRFSKDKAKTKYMLGTDKKLYEWCEGNVPGKEVGYQIEKKNGKNTYKFICK